jgi:hypothetical protein
MHCDIAKSVGLSSFEVVNYTACEEACCGVLKCSCWTWISGGRYSACFQTDFCTRRCHWIPRVFA